MFESEHDRETICPRCSKLITGPDSYFCPSCGVRLSIPQQMDLEHLHKTHSPESIQCPYAGFWIRMCAFWMDNLLVLLLVMFLGSLAYSTTLGRELFPNLEKVNLFMVILFIGYHGLFLGKFSATPGKWFFGLSVKPANPKTRFGYAEAFLRTLSYFISLISLCIGFLWIGLSRDKQGWHDKIARTVVIKKLRVPLVRRFASLILLTLLVFLMIAIQFNLTWVYQSVLNSGSRLFGSRGKEIVSVLVTQKELRKGSFKEINTRAGPHTIRVPSSARDGEIFKVNRPEEEGGVFYIKVVIVEYI